MFVLDVPEVSPDDIVVTVDVNLFVMTPNILDFISLNPNMLAWVPQVRIKAKLKRCCCQYVETASIPTGHGETFNQNLIGLRAKDWARITGFAGDLEALLTTFRARLQLGEESRWWTDQLVGLTCCT